MQGQTNKHNCESPRKHRHSLRQARTQPYEQTHQQITGSVSVTLITIPDKIPKALFEFNGEIWQSARVLSYFSCKILSFIVFLRQREQAI